MTLVEIKNQIVAHFLVNDTFIVNEHMKGIEVSKPQEKLKTGLVKAVLAGLAEEGFVGEIKDDQDVTAAYTTMFPLGSEGQQVPISFSIASFVASIVNQYRDAMDDEEGLVDALNLTENDILNLCMICNQLMATQDGGLAETT